jgi:hypothetical protein
MHDDDKCLCPNCTLDRLLDGAELETAELKRGLGSMIESLRTYYDVPKLHGRPIKGTQVEMTAYLTGMYDALAAVGAPTFITKDPDTFRNAMAMGMSLILKTPDDKIKKVLGEVFANAIVEIKEEPASADGGG